MLAEPEIVTAGDAPGGEPAPEIRLAGHAFVPDVSGALWWPAQRTLIAADLHLEKGSAMAARRMLLPPYDSLATLKRLIESCARLSPLRLILVGDTFHDGGGCGRLGAPERALFETLAAGAELIVVAGNHDPAPPAGLPVSWCGDLRLDGLLLRHEPCRSGDAACIAGHLHPVAKVPTRAGAVRRRCFVADGGCLVLPAFGAYAGGLNIRDAAFAPLFAAIPRVFALGRRQVFEVGYRSLLRDQSNARSI